MQEITRETIKVCRICGNENLKPVILLKKMPFTDEFISKDKIGTEFLADIEISVCSNCGCAQNINDTDMGDYYFDYTYSVQSSGFALQFMRILAERVKSLYFSNHSNPSILEIGSGTGEQLIEFKKIGFNVLGIEPSDKLSKFANQNGARTLNSFFDENTTEILEPFFKEVDAIITSYTFDHIAKPVEVLQNIHQLLKSDGLLIVEVHDLELIRQRNEFCLFEHEHYTYLNENTIGYLFNQNKFEVLTFDLLKNEEKRANSLLVVARKREKVIDSKIDAKQEINKLLNLNDEIHKSILRIENWLTENCHLKIIAYGAGGRGVMTIASLKNSNLIKYIVDKNPKSNFIFSPKSHLPVFGIQQLGIDTADKIIIFSFGYYKEIVKELIEKFGYEPEQFISILDLLEPSHA